jgi:hypothetical protein
VLFALDESNLTEGEVEFVISLSRGALQGPGVPLLPDLHCRGRIVRVSTGARGEAIVAASIRRQSLRRVDASDGRGVPGAPSEPPEPLASPPAP